MKIFIYLFCAGAAFSFAACTSNTSVKGMSDKDSAGNNMRMAAADDEREAKEKRNKSIVLQSLEGVNKHDAMAVLKDAAPGVVDYGDGSQPPLKGKDSTIVMINNWMKAFPDVKGENLKTVADDDWVIVWGDWSGTWNVDFYGNESNWEVLQNQRR